MSITSPNGNFRGYWQLRIYDATGKLVDLPQSDIEEIQVQDQINGGSGTGKVTFRRTFNQIGALGYGYAFLLWFWPYGSSQPVDPWYGGYLVDFDQVQLATTGQVVCYLEGDCKKLDAAIVTESIAPNVGGNPNLDAATYCTHLLTTYQPPSFTAPSVPASMFNLLPLQFDGSKLGACIDTVTKLGRDASGVLYTWVVRTKHDLTRQVVIQKDQNPNVVSGVAFKHLFVGSQLDQYKITNKYRDIINVVAVYGGKDSVTGQQCYGVYEDAASAAPPPSGYGPIEDKISVPTLTSNAACQSYGQTWLDLNAYPQAQGSARLLTPDPGILGGTWVQIWEAPATASVAASIKQVRVAQVSVLIKGERIEQTISTVSPVPYLDEAIYRLGQHASVQTAIANKPLPINTQQLYVRSGGYVTSTASSPAKIALAATDAVFPGGEVNAAAFPLTTLVDNSGGPNNGLGGDGYYTLSLNNAGAYVITKGAEPAASLSQQNLCGATVVAGVPFTVDRRTINVSAAAVAAAIDLNGNLLLTEFPGGKVQADGSVTNVDGATGHTAIPISGSSIIHAEGNFAKGASSMVSHILIGTSTAGYQLNFDSTGNVAIFAAVNGVYTQLAVTAGPTNDTNAHRLALTVVSQGGPNHIVEGSVDGIIVSASDASVYLTSPCTVQVTTGGSSGSLKDYSFGVGADHYSMTPGQVRGIINRNGQIPVSSSLNPNGTLLPIVPNGSLAYVSTTSTITWYWDGSNGSVAFVLTFPDASTQSVPASNQQFTGYSASTTYYYVARISAAAPYTLQVAVQSGGASANATDHAWLNADGYIGIAANLTAATTSSGSSGGSGGGSTTTCPADDQLVPTTRGVIPAREIVAGDHVFGPDGKPVPVLYAESRRSVLVRVIVAGEPIDVDYAHRWQDPDGRWVSTTDLHIGSLLRGSDGQTIYSVDGVIALGEGWYRKLKVVGGCLRIGNLVGTNVTTL